MLCTCCYSLKHLTLTTELFCKFICITFILKQAKEKHKKQNEKLLKRGKVTETFHMRSKDGAILTILPPIVYNLKVNKSKTRKVFTFKCIQSSQGVTHLRETGLVYNNVYPDVERDSGLIRRNRIRKHN